MDDDIEKNREVARKENGLYSVSYLKNNLRMKPKKDVSPREYWVNHYKKTYAVYSLDDCECIPDLTENKKISLKISNLKRKITNEKKYLLSSFSSEACDILERNSYFLDTETTGLGDCSQVIEVGIIDCDENIIFESRYKPTVEIETGAQEVHGISKKSLEKEKIFSDDAKKIKDILLNNFIVIFNSSFDLRLLKNTYEAFDVDCEFLNDVKTKCAMYLSAGYYGATNKYGSISLFNVVAAAELEGNDFGAAHSAVGDCRATLAVIKKIASDKKISEKRIEKLEMELVSLEEKRKSL